MKKIDEIKTILCLGSLLVGQGQATEVNEPPREVQNSFPSEPVIVYDGNPGQYQFLNQIPFLGGHPENEAVLMVGRPAQENETYIEEPRANNAVPSGIEIGRGLAIAESTNGSSDNAPLIILEQQNNLAPNETEEVPVEEAPHGDFFP